MSKAQLLQKNVLNRMVEKYIKSEYKDSLQRLAESKRHKLISLTEAVSKDSIIEILDQILEYATRSKKDLDSDNAEMLKVDLAQIITFSEQLQTLINEDESMATDTGTSNDTGENTEAEDTNSDTANEPQG